MEDGLDPEERLYSGHGQGTLFWKVSLWTRSEYELGMALESQGWTGLRGHLGQPLLPVTLLLARADVQDPCRGGRVSSPRPLTEPVFSAIEQSHLHPRLLSGPCWRAGDPRSAQGHGCGPGHALLLVWEGM